MRLVYLLPRKFYLAYISWLRGYSFWLHYRLYGRGWVVRHKGHMYMTGYGFIPSFIQWFKYTFMIDKVWPNVWDDRIERN